MSLQAMANVIDRAPERDGEYQLLLTLANRADSAGRGVWYDAERIAFEARMTVAGAVRIVERLLDSGRLLLETGAGPKGGDLLHIQLPPVKLTREVWAVQRGKALEVKRTTRKSAPGRWRSKGRVQPTQNAEPGLKVNPGLQDSVVELSPKVNPGLQLFSLKLGTKLNPGLQKSNPGSLKNTLPNRPGADFPALYSPCTIQKEVVIDLASKGTQPAPAGESLLARLLDLAQSDHWDGAGPETQKDQPPVTEEAWDENDEALFGPLSGRPAVDEAAPDGAGRPVEVVTPLRNEDSGDAEDENVTSLEQIPPAAPALAGPAAEADMPLWDTPEHVAPAARPEWAAPGSPVYARLTALCGGAVRDPNLPRLLAEKTRADGPRRAWLALCLPEIEDAVVAARARVARGESLTFRTALIDSLDALVDGTPLDTAPVPRGEPAKVAWDEIARPGDGGTAPQKLTFTQGQRVRKDKRLGVVWAVAADARQANVTVDFDDGERVIFTDQQARKILRDVLESGAPPPPARSLVGSRWLHKATGKLLTVIAVSAGRPVTDDGTTWPAYGRDILGKHTDRADQGIEGAA